MLQNCNCKTWILKLLCLEKKIVRTIFLESTKCYSENLEQYANQVPKIYWALSISIFIHHVGKQILKSTVFI
jgi:hypothetical protein